MYHVLLVMKIPVISDYNVRSTYENLTGGAGHEQLLIGGLNSEWINLTSTVPRLDSIAYCFSLFLTKLAKKTMTILRYAI